MELSKSQNDIVLSDSRNIVVDAAAGSGKTRVLVERVKHLISKGADPNRIVIITYTNKAADELVQRLSSVSGSDKCFIGTIHSYAYKLLRRNDMTFEIFSEDIQTRYMRYLIEKYGYRCTFSDYELFVKLEKLVSLGKMSKNDVSKHFSDISVYNEIMNLLGRETSYACKETVVTLCKQNNVLTFDDLIESVTKQKLFGKIEHLFVDEVQDIGYLEFNFLLALKAENNFMIGDDYQNIYGFRGGDVRIFLSLIENDDWKTYTLSENYRCARSIIDYANNIIKNATDIVNKDVVAFRDTCGDVQFFSKSMLAKEIKKLQNEKFLILVRTNKEASSVCAALKADGIPYRQARSEDSVDSINENIIIMTVHQAKGLECKNVAIYGKFPFNGKGSSDELKVLYVAITRAMDRLYVFI